MLWLVVIFITFILAYFWMSYLEKQDVREQSKSESIAKKTIRKNESILEKEIRTSLQRAGMDSSDETVQYIKGLHQTHLHAIAYINGDGVPQSYAKAHQLWIGIADRYAIANVGLGELAKNGYLGVKDAKQALQYFHQALEIDVSCHEAMLLIGIMYAEGEWVAQDNAQAFEWISKSSALGNIDAEHQLAWMYYFGRGVAEHKVKAFIKWSALAKQGHTASQHSLGLACYLQGQGTAQNFEQAFYWINLAAQNGHIDAISNLGVLYMFGWGTQVDFDQARHWLEQAVAQQHVQAICNYAQLLLMENEQDIAKVEHALELWHSIMEQEEEALNNIGLLYLFGCTSLAVDYEKALPYLKRSAEHGNLAGCVAYAMCLVKLDSSDQNRQLAYDYVKQVIRTLAQKDTIIDVMQSATYALLGMVYIEGEIMDKNIQTAISYLEKAANLNHSEAQYQLGKLYDEGGLIQQDKNKALSYYQQAAIQHNIHAKNALAEWQN